MTCPTSFRAQAIECCSQDRTPQPRVERQEAVDLWERVRDAEHRILDAINRERFIARGALARNTIEHVEPMFVQRRQSLARSVDNARGNTRGPSVVGNRDRGASARLVATSD